MIGFAAAVLLLASAIGAAVKAVRAAGGRAAVGRGSKPLAQVGSQYRVLLSRRSFLRLGTATLGAAVLANSGADEAVTRWYGRRIHGPRSDALSGAAKQFGEKPWFLLWGGFALLDGFVATNPFLRWGRRNFEAMIVGLPVLWTLQRGGGAGRPTDEHHDARWRPLQDDNTASGHTFMAAVPWLNAGRGLDQVWLGRAAWLASWGTGWSRLNDRKHYLSQVGLGHVVAETAVAAVEEGS